ncbi:MAG: tetratricopeptide repeat protein [Betaproteobacteria bacterium]
MTLASAFAQAFADDAAGREAEALAAYQRILAAAPNHPGALLKIAESEIRRGEWGSARLRLVAALDAGRRMQLPLADVWVALGRLDRLQGNETAAGAAFGHALADSPTHPWALLESGATAHRAGEFDVAEKHCRAAAAHDPELGAAWLQLAWALEQQGRFSAAREATAAAMAARKTSAAAWENAVRLALAAHDLVGAGALSRDGLDRYPHSPGVLHQHGILLKTAGMRGAACAVLERAVALAPADAGLKLSLGGALLDAHRAGEAKVQLEKAIELGVQSGEVWDNLGIALRTLGDDEAAVGAFQNAVAASPRLVPALANLLQARQQACAWEGIEALEQQLVATLDDPASDPRWPPFVALGMNVTSAQQLVVARRWAKAMLPVPAAPPVVPARAGRLRIGFLSSDFREHPTGRLMAGLFEARDRNAFELFAYSYGTDDGSSLRQRIRAAFDTWRDVDAMADADVARQMREDAIDVLIDRKGFTRGSRLAILAHRGAPVQLHYMSFPGTLGFDAIDGIIADDEVIPPGEEAFFHERVWRMPRCYFVNDAWRTLPATDVRSHHGLAEDALVLACFNQPYKLTPPVFAIWMDALRAAPSAILWLLAASAVQQRNLHAEAMRAGIDPQRIVFAPALPQPAHMARVGCADLTLDTLPVGQHTTACDALWMGVPMLTCRGATFAGRVGASLLRAVELPELITDSLRAYRERLLALVAAPAALNDYRRHLTRERHRLPLFDTRGFARDWEALLVRAHDATIAGRAASV